jgi:hypothetical protein
MENTNNSVISYVQGEYRIGDYNMNDWWHDYYPHEYPITYPQYYFYAQPNVEDKTSKAFKIANKLLEKKFIDLPTVKEFIDIVNAIVEVL